MFGSPTPTTATGAAVAATGTPLSSSTTNPVIMQSDDFSRLESANAIVVEALRADEAASDADLYRRLLGPTGPGSHLYYPAGDVGTTMAPPSGVPSGGLHSVGGHDGVATDQAGSTTGAGGRAPAGLAPGTPFGASHGFSTTRGRSRSSSGEHTFETGPTSRRGTGAGSVPFAQSPGTSSTEQAGLDTTGSIDPPILPSSNVKHVSSIPLPPFLSREVSQRTKLFSAMGLLPQANLAWISLDSTLYLWSYDDAINSLPATASLAGSIEGQYTDFCSFNVPSQQSVANVGIAKPKPSVFKSFVKWVIVVATEAEVILCALASRSETAVVGAGGFGPNASLQLIPTTFVLPTDGVPISTIESTESDGRIFLGGSDGNLYEFSYDISTQTPAAAVPSEDEVDEHEDDEDEDGSGPNWTSTIASGSKRLLSNFLFSSSSKASQPARKKSRKLNHTQPSFLATLFPGFLHRLMLLSTGATGCDGSPIVDIAIDEERGVLHSLNANGILSTYTLSSTTLQLVHAIDLCKVSKSYLEALSLYSMYSTSKDFTFAGGAGCALAGLGGQSSASGGPNVDCVKVLLKLATNTTDTGAGKPPTRMRHNNINIRGVLHPLRAFVVPPSLSSKICLVLVTEGGLRLYLSLPDGRRGMETSPGSATLPPGKMQLCHIRSPPSSTIMDSVGVAPGVLRPVGGGGMSALARGMLSSAYGSYVPVVSSHYDATEQALVLGLDGHAFLGVMDDNPYAGVAVLAAVSDVAYRDDESLTDSAKQLGGTGAFKTAPVMTSAGALGEQKQRRSKPAGLNEVLTSPLPLDNMGILAGGRMCQISGSGSVTETRLALLIHRSVTPSMDSEVHRDLLHLPACPPVTSLRLRKSIGGPKKKYKLSGEGEWKRGFLISRVGNSSAVKSAMGSPSRTGGASSFMLGKSSSLPLLAQQMYRYLFSSPFKRNNDILILNSGGLNFFRVSSVIDLFAGVLMVMNPLSMNANVGKVAATRFVSAYGQAEVCAMSLAIAIAPSSSVELMQRAKRMALSYGGRPAIDTTDTAPHADVGTTAVPSGALAPPGVVQTDSSRASQLVFHPSSLHQGVATLLSRLLRPLWFKPVIMVTPPSSPKAGKGTSTKKDGKRLRKPHVVELLLDSVTLDDLYRQLREFQEVMKDIFAPAIFSVPGSSGEMKHGALERKMEMDVDELSDGHQWKGYLTTSAALMQYHSSQSQSHRSSTSSSEDRQATARLLEETSIHNMYRLLSRATQALSLLNILLRYSQSQNRLIAGEEVEWGLLHNLTMHQIVCAPEAADRVTALLQSLLLSCSSSPSSLDCEKGLAMQLAQTLSSQCYLFFSKADYIAQEAMHASIVARGEIPGSEKFRTLSNRSAVLWTKAAACWRSSRLITGKILHPNSFGKTPSQGFSFPDDPEMLASGSEYASSPLVKACVALYFISNVAGIVEVCLTCAANFGGTFSGSEGEDGISANMFSGISNDAMPWEDGIYRSDSISSSSRDVALSSSSTANSKTTSGVRDLVGSQSLSASETLLPISPTAVSVSVPEGDFSPSDARKFCYALVVHFLRLLLGRQEVQDREDQSSEKLAEVMLSVCAASEDQFFHCTLYEFLLRNDYISTLLRLQTPYLEEWLAAQKEVDATQMLYRYYIVHGRYDLACAVMERKGSVETEDIALEERVKFLTRSLSAAAESSGVLGDRAIDAMKMNELKGKLEVASLQQRILSALSGCGDETGLDAEKYHALAFKLLSVSELFNDYSAPMGLYEICLLIMNVCKTNDPDTIEKLWKSILSRELQGVWSERSDVQGVIYALKDGTPVEDSIEESERSEFENGEWIRPLKEKITGLGRELWGKGADFTVPLLVLVPALEGLRQAFLVATAGGRTQSSVAVESLHWPVLSLAQAGIPYSTILECYRMILSDKEREGDAEESLHYLSCISEVLTEWIKSAYSARSKSALSLGRANLDGETDSLSENCAVQLLRARSAGLVNVIDNYKSSLEAMVGKSREANQLLRIFADIEGALRSF